jgi:hypothetical protein
LKSVSNSYKATKSPKAVGMSPRHNIIVIRQILLHIVVTSKKRLSYWSIYFGYAPNTPFV